MVVPKRSDQLIKHLMASDKFKAQRKEVPKSSEESEYYALDWDIKQGLKLPPHKMERYLVLKERFGK